MTNYFAQILLLAFAVNASVCACGEVKLDLSDPLAHHQTEDCLHSECSGDCGEILASSTGKIEKHGSTLKLADGHEAMSQTEILFWGRDLQKTLGRLAHRYKNTLLATTPLLREKTASSFSAFQFSFYF